MALAADADGRVATRRGGADEVREQRCAECAALADGGGGDDDHPDPGLILFYAEAVHRGDCSERAEGVKVIQLL